MFLMILKRKEGKGKERLRERERDLSPVNALTSYRTHNLFGAQGNAPTNRASQPGKSLWVYFFSEI